MQIASLDVVRRENTGAGFYTYFGGLRSGPPIKSRTISNVYGDVAGLKHSMVFVLFSREGKVDVLEGAAVDDDTAKVDFSTAEFTIAP